MIPTTYEAWRSCIEVDCRIPLSPEFIAQRRRELDDPSLHSTEQLHRHYGPEHLQRLRQWFAQAERDLHRSSA